MSTYRIAAKSQITLVHVPTTGPERLITYENPVMSSRFAHDKFAVVYSHPIAEKKIRHFLGKLRRSAHWRLEVGICASRLPWDAPAEVDLPENERFEGVFGDAHVSFFVSNKPTRDTIQIPIAESEVEALMQQIDHLWLVKYRPVAAEYRRAIEVVYKDLFSNHPRDTRAAAAAAIRDEEERLWKADNILVPIRGSDPLMFTPASTEDAGDALPHIIHRLRKMLADDETARAAATVELLAIDDRPSRSQRKKTRMRAKACAQEADRGSGNAATDRPAKPAEARPCEAPPCEPTEAPSTEPTEAPSAEPTEAPSAETLPAEPSPAEPSKAPLIKPAELSEIGSADCCIVCEEGAKDMVIVPCGHVCACRACAATFRHCPVCRVAVQATLRIFMC